MPPSAGKEKDPKGERPKVRSAFAEASAFAPKWATADKSTDRE